MSTQYLNKFKSNLPQIQGKQLLKLLTTKRDSGEIRTLTEFKSKLTELTNKLIEERITPTITLFNAVAGQDISSEQYNEMLERIQDDLEAAFSEADNLDDVIAAHHNIIQDVSLKSIRFGINKLEAQISLYEFINRNGFGFSNAINNTFREAEKLTTSRADKVAAFVFIDPRKKELIPTTQDAQVDLVGERLLLAADQSNILVPRNAHWLSNSNSIRGEIDVRFPNSSITNIFDGRNNTYWVAPILLSSIKASGASLEVSLELNGHQSINSVEIEPAVEFPLVLTSVGYLGPSNTIITILSTETDIRGPVSISFDRITTDNLVLRFRQDNYKEVQFVRKAGESNFHRAILNQFTSVDLPSVSEDLREILSSDFLLSQVLAVPSRSTIVEKYFEYLTGFDNIRPIFKTFSNRSIFVSNRIDINNPGQVGLSVIEKRPTQAQSSTEILTQDYSYPAGSTESDELFHHGVIEYWLFLQSFSDDEFLISTDIIPILPLGADRVNHEQLILTHKTVSTKLNPDMGSFMFYTNDNPNDVKVYRNGTILTYGTDTSADWEFVGPDENIDNEEITFTTPNASSRMKRGIRLWSSNVNPLDIYTVSYTPLVSNIRAIPSDPTLFNIVDLVGDQSIRVSEENIIIFEQSRKSHIVARIEAYLIIIMRRNSANDNFTPILEEYTFSWSSRDPTRFI